LLTAAHLYSLKSEIWNLKSLLPKPEGGCNLSAPLVVLEKTMPDRSDVLQGTLDLLILQLLARDADHGWGLTLKLEEHSGGVLLVNQGSLYPALERLTRNGAIRNEWRVTENNRRARYYLITAAGRKRLAAERAAWRRASAAVNAILSLAGDTP
jgi:transcriptional regulator